MPHESTEHPRLSLSKASAVVLTHEGHKLTQLCVGLNWGAIQRKGFLGWGLHTERVDLDASITMFDAAGQAIDTVYYRQLRSHDGAVWHTGDDRVGDVAGDDEEDNEVIALDLSKVNTAVQQMVCYLTSYKRHDFASIPYTKIRIFEGEPQQPKLLFASFSINAEAAYKHCVAMIMGKWIRQGEDWVFVAIGEPSPTRSISETIAHIQTHYL